MLAVFANFVVTGDKITELEYELLRDNVNLIFSKSESGYKAISDLGMARESGMPDVFAHGMLSMAYLGRMLTNWQPQAKLRKFGNKFAAITHLQDAITCSGKVVEILEHDGETLARCEIQAVKENGKQTLVGEALVAL